ncbi:uncharacterized protein LOC124665618 [Lolium rigidum]|uniref:uncharacterized protein LOC124665618 n=1 Tax=Lolium rigidum TaxID=89674 RepID=UPI001F5D4AB2|nr:uncharacterized protein LOC124665618 [Lolium rigidum]XP_047058970.1 uncharacterized protein LOC124665618 [Lolium rigidum]
MEEQVSRGAVERRLSYHATHYPNACADHAGPEHPGDLLEVAEPHDQPAHIVTDLDPCEIAQRALDLMFPREDSDWSSWSAREEGTSDDDDVETVQVIVGDEEETDCPGENVVDDCSTGEGSDYDDDRQVIDDDEETNCPGKLYPESEADEIERKWAKSTFQQFIEYTNIWEEIMALGDEDDTPLPPRPMKVFPDATGACVLGLDCHHRVYRTHDTSTTPSTLGYRTPEAMLQIFSLCLSSSEPSCPTSVYGIFAIRDNFDPRRNYVFNRARVDAVAVQKQESFVLPLCSPCRGMYVSDKALLEVDLWENKEGDESADKQQISAYVEINIVLEHDFLFCGRIPGDKCNLDITYTVLSRSVEAVIQVYAKVDHPHHVRFMAFSTGYCKDGVMLLDDKLFGSEKLFQHIVAVKANEELDVVLEVDNSLFKWTFRDEYVGAVISPDDSIFDYGLFFVRVMFAPKDSQ